jgi:acyl-[acyl-carrier-protein]-phospholipid O-acyltransferase/long-chain-fatty-acid--[acyl-carrier-protein] ligase
VTVPSSTPATIEEATRPKLLADVSFWGIAVTQFLGAFNDNLYKQMVLLMSITTVAGQVSEDTQGYATALFSLPFVLLSGFAGYLSDRWSKSKIIVLCKLAEIAIMLLAMFAFLQYARVGAFGTWTVLFLMGTQSAFFGPGKYGVLPELFRKEDLPRANGLILMSTFLAIILGVVFAGTVKDLLTTRDEAGKEDFSNLWIGSLVCIGIASAGTITALLIRYTKPAQPEAKVSWEDIGVSPSIRALLWRDRPLLAALIVSSAFWLVSGVVMPTVNALGKAQLQLNSDTKTSILTGALAIGIIIGSVLANIVFKRKSATFQVLSGTIGMILSLAVTGLWKRGGEHLLGYWGALLGLISCGMFAAIFILPIQVFMQSRPPAEAKGRMIGTMNLVNFIGLLLAGPLYQIFLKITQILGWPVSAVFIMLTVLLIPIAIRFRMPSNSTVSTVLPQQSTPD